MKKIVLSIMAAALLASGSFAQTVKLPAPQKTGGKSINETLTVRESRNEFSNKMLSKQDLSNLLYAAIGVNRENGKLTSPTASNKQEIRIFVFTAEGVSEYLNNENGLRPVAKGDHRGIVAGRQDWVKAAPVVLVLVADGDKFGRVDERSKTMMAVDAGIVSENINLFCAGNGLATRPRASMDAEAISTLLGLTENQYPIMNNPVGYQK